MRARGPSKNPISGNFMNENSLFNGQRVALALSTPARMPSAARVRSDPNNPVYGHKTPVEGASGKDAPKRSHLQRGKDAVRLRASEKYAKQQSISYHNIL